MTQSPDEIVIAYVDGRLDGAERDAFEARMADDSALADGVAAHRWMARQIVAAYPVPAWHEGDQELASRLGLDPTNQESIVPISAHRARQTGWKAAWIPTALAASLVLGVFIGQTPSAPDEALLAFREGQPFASGQLAESLSHKLSGEDGVVRVSFSFRTKEGMCRAFRTAQGLSGVGCRAGSGWAVPIHEAGNPGAADAAEYRLAGGDVAPSVLAAVDRMMLGEPLSLYEEARLRKTEWR